MALARETPSESVKPSLDLYVSETAPSPVERRSWIRWFLLALIAILLHGLAFWLLPRFFPEQKPAPVEVSQIDPAKLRAIKNAWKNRPLVLQKDPSKPKQNIEAPKDARYESDRNQKVDRETRARMTDVIPTNPGDPNGKSARDQNAKKRGANHDKNPAKNMPLSQLSNFQSLPRPASSEEEHEAEARRGSTTPGDQSIDDPNLPTGAENMLNTAESVYYTFYARIYEQIGPIWQSGIRTVISRTRIAPGEYVTRAEVIFDSEGNYLETRIAQGSGNTELDRVVPNSWAKIPRFPNPPKGLIQPDGKIHMGWTFSVHMDSQTGWQYAPPQREY